MAYLDLTLLNARQFDNVQNDIQNQRYGTLRAVEASTDASPVISESVKAFLMTVNDQPFTIPALEEAVITTTTAESFTIPANLTPSATITATRVTIFAGFHHFPAVHASNVIGMESYFQHQITLVGKAMAKAKAAAIIAVLEANKTQVMTGADGVVVPGFTFSGVTDILTISKAGQESNFFGNFRNLNEDNFMGDDQLMIVSSLGLTVVFTKWFQNGGDQAVNQQNRMNMPIPNFDSKELGALDASTVGKGFTFVRGAIGEVENFTFDFMNRTKTDKTQWDITAGEMPFLNRRTGVMFRVLDEDGTSIPAGSVGSITATSREEYGYAHKFFLLSTFKTDITARPSDVVKFNLADS